MDNIFIGFLSMLTACVLKWTTFLMLFLFCFISYNLNEKEKLISITKGTSAMLNA